MYEIILLTDCFCLIDIDKGFILLINYYKSYFREWCRFDYIQLETWLKYIRHFLSYMCSWVLTKHSVCLVLHCLLNIRMNTIKNTDENIWVHKYWFPYQQMKLYFCFEWMHAIVCRNYAVNFTSNIDTLYVWCINL